MSLPVSPRRNRPIPFVVLAGLALVLGGAAWRPATPAIGALSATTLARRARLLVDGAGFGDLQGTSRVEIAGVAGYVGTALLGGGTIDPYSYLYAIKATDLAGAPGEAAVTRPMTVRKGAGSSLVLDYGSACNATDHTLYWFSASGPGPIAWAGSVCGLGTGPTAPFDPGTPAVGSAIFFVVVGHNATVEGSYGRSFTGVERPRATGMTCSRPQIVATSCAP